MTRKYFGTDGVRGRANAGNMTPDVVMRIGMADGLEYFNFTRTDQNRIQPIAIEQVVFTLAHSPRQSASSQENTR